MKNKIIIIVIAFCGLLSTYGQQEPHYTQYMYNMSVVNPAYVLDEPGKIQLGTLYRMQWLGMNNAGPRTANIFGHYSINKNVELSLNYVSDKIGNISVMNQDLLNVDFAYRFKLNEKLKLSLGIKAGLSHIGVDFTNSNLQVSKAFQNTNSTSPLVGAGAFLFQENYYVGISSPNLLPSELATNDGIVHEISSHVNLIGGYIFDISSSVRFKPSTVLKFVDGAPLNFDVSANFLINEKFEAGVAYRYEDAVTAMIGFYIQPNFRIGYAYDHTLSGLNDFNSGSHEIILLYDFNLIGLSKKYLSPRFY